MEVAQHFPFSSHTPWVHFQRSPVWHDEPPKNAPKDIAQKAALHWKKRNSQSIKIHYYSLQKCPEFKEKVEFCSKIQVDKCWRVRDEILQWVEGDQLDECTGRSSHDSWEMLPMPRTSLAQSSSAEEANTSTAKQAFPRKLFLLTVSSDKDSLKSFASFYFNTFCVFSFRTSFLKSPQRRSFPTLPID